MSWCRPELASYYLTSTPDGSNLESNPHNVTQVPYQLDHMTFQEPLSSRQSTSAFANLHDTSRTSFFPSINFCLCQSMKMKSPICLASVLKTRWFFYNKVLFMWLEMKQTLDVLRKLWSLLISNEGFMMSQYTRFYLFLFLSDWLIHRNVDVK